MNVSFLVSIAVMMNFSKSGVMMESNLLMTFCGGMHTKLSDR